MPTITLQLNHTDFSTHPDYIDLPDHTYYPNNLLGDRNLSGQSLGLITYLLAQPEASTVDNQKINVRAKSEYSKNKALKILVHFGYLVIERIDRHTYIWHVYDTPQNDIPQDISATEWEV